MLVDATEIFAERFAQNIVALHDAGLDAVEETQKRAPGNWEPSYDKLIGQAISRLALTASPLGDSPQRR